jgi:Ran GTPase-activating protein (RanGAP) involved in mRNA processing and transport/tetratricopeptide (TPR) repeat protein
MGMGNEEEQEGEREAEKTNKEKPVAEAEEQPETEEKPETKDRVETAERPEAEEKPELVNVEYDESGDPIDPNSKAVDPPKVPKDEKEKVEQKVEQKEQPVAVVLIPKEKKQRARTRWKQACKIVIRQNLEYYAWDAESNEKLGNRFAAEGKYTEAVLKLRRSIGMGGDGGQLWRKLGECMLQMWKINIENKRLLQRALDAYGTALKKIECATNPMVFAECAEVYERMGDWENALNLLSHIIDTFPQYGKLSDVIFRCASLLEHTGLSQKNPKQRETDLTKALDYMTYIVDSPPTEHKRDYQLHLARLYDLVPTVVQNKEQAKAKKKNQFMARESYKDLFKQMKETVKHDPYQKAFWRSKNWQYWFFDPVTWLKLAQEYYDRSEYTWAIDAYRTGISRYRIRFGEEAPPESSWDWPTWSYQPYPEQFMKLAHCYRAIQDKARALEAAEQALELAPYSIEIRDTLAKWSKRKWGRRNRKQDKAATTMQRIQKGCWGRRRARLRLREVINEAEHRRQTYRMDLSCRPLLQVFRGPTWRPLFAVEEQCASKLAAFSRGCKDRAEIAEMRMANARRELNSVIQEWHRNVWNTFSRAKLARMSPRKYGKLFALEERAASSLRRAWIKLGAKKAASRRAGQVKRLRVESTNNAATEIQNEWHAYRVRCKRAVRREGKKEQENAALQIQKRMRGRGAKKELKKRKAANVALLTERREQQRGARLIQARWRGRRSRLEIAAEHHAAEKVQAIFRGKIGRKLVARRQYKYASRVQAFFSMVHEGYRVAGALETRIGGDDLQPALSLNAHNTFGAGGGGGGGRYAGSSKGRQLRDSVNELAQLMTAEAVGAVRKVDTVDPRWAPPGGGLLAVEHVTKGTGGVPWGHCYRMTEGDADGLSGGQGRSCMQRVLGVNTLHAEDVELDADGAKTLALGLTRNRTLNHLLLRNTCIGGEGMLALAKALGDNTTLSTFAVGASEVGPDTEECPAIATLANTLRTTNYRLRQLLIEDNQIGDDACAELGRAVGDFFAAQYCKIQRLALNRLGMREMGGAAIGLALETSVTLVSVQLCGNSLRDEAAAAIAKALGKNRVLRELDLSDNKISSEGGIALALGLAQNETLQKLLVPNNFMKEDAWRAFKGALTYDNSTLQLLSLEGNMMPTFTHQQVAHFFRQRKRIRKQLPPVKANAIGKKGGRPQHRTYWSQLA